MRRCCGTWGDYAAVLALVSLASCTAQTSECAEPDLEETEHAAFVVLPDTQFYTCAYPMILSSQVQWIVDNAESLDVGVVVHTGDIVDQNTHEQWQTAAEALHRLDGWVSYLLTVGNHDILTDRTSLIDEYFDAADLTPSRCAARLKDRHRIENSYTVVNLRGSPWLFVGLEFAPRDATLDWAGRVLQDHAGTPAVLFTHAYLSGPGQRYDRTASAPQPHHPDSYGLPTGAGIADGRDIWEALVEPHENVKLVLSGHVVPNGTARSVAVRASGSHVHEVLTNFQTCDRCPCAEVDGGGGYLRVFELDKEQTALRVRTYSPYYDQYLMDEENEFELVL